MAYIRISPIRTGTHLQQCIDYIENPDKTEEMLYISSYMCDTVNTAKDFAEIARLARHGGNRSAAGRELGISPRMMNYRLKKAGIG